MSILSPSKRGRAHVHPDLMIDLSRRLDENKYHRTKNPRGIVDIGSAVNELMINDLEKWMKKHKNSFDTKKHIRYGDTQGSPELPDAAANFINKFFSPHRHVKRDNILVTNGVTAALDTLTYNLLDEDQVILCPTPAYGMFSHNVSTRNGVSLVSVPCDDFDQFAEGETLTGRFEESLNRIQNRGHKVSAILLSNPNNPLGRCYKRSVITQLVSFCQKKNLHLIVDEIYAMSGGDRFVSFLSVEKEFPENVHVLWGMSKDFGAGGLRIGFLITYNKALYESMRTLSMFTWVSAFSADITTKLLTDMNYISRKYLPAFRRRLTDRRSSAMKFLTDSGIPFEPSDSGLFVFIDLSRWLDYFDEKNAEMALLEYLMTYLVFLEPGSAFNSTYSGYFRLSFTRDEQTVLVGLDRLKAALQSLDDSDEAFEKAIIRSRKWLCI